MRRNKTTDTSDYIRIRVSQLEDELKVTHNEHDRAWYNRLIQELRWVDNMKHNCGMSSDARSDWF